MRILQVHGRYRSTAPSGENRVVDQEAAQLREAGHEVGLFEKRSDDIETWPVVRKAGLPARVLWSEEARRELGRRLERDRPDVVHVHNTFPLLSASVLHACHRAGVPVVATLHNYKLLCASGEFYRDGRTCHDCAAGALLPGIAHGCYRGSRLATVPVAASTALHRSAWRTLVSAYVFISAAQRDLMAGLDLPPERVFVKHNFVPEGPPVLAARRHRVAYLGRLDAAKGLPLLMEAWDVFRARHRDAPLRLAVAGGGPLEEQVRAWAGARPDVDFLGILDAGRAQDLLRDSLAAVVPSQWEETFGLVAVEAMACGVVPVAPARGSFPEIVRDGVDGVLFAPDDPGSLATVLAQVDQQPDHFVRLGRSARAAHAARFASDVSLARLVEIYEFARSRPIGALHVGV
jgi:glycosyltransferase involved in cell wall biosynthesis